MMRLSMPVRKCLFSIRGIPRLMRDPEYRDWIPVFTGMTREETRDPFPPVILNRKRSASDWGSSWIWIPVFTGMTRELDSRFHGNDRENNGNYREEYRNNKTSEVATLEIVQLYQ